MNTDSLQQTENNTNKHLKQHKQGTGDTGFQPRDPDPPRGHNMDLRDFQIINTAGIMWLLIRWMLIIPDDWELKVLLSRYGNR